VPVLAVMLPRVITGFGVPSQPAVMVTLPFDPLPLPDTSINELAGNRIRPRVVPPLPRKARRLTLPPLRFPEVELDCICRPELEEKSMMPPEVDVPLTVTFPVALPVTGGVVLMLVVSSAGLFTPVRSAPATM
jgi:hypothetical protein